MEVLVFSRKLWKVFGVCLNEPANFRDKLMSLLANIYIIIMLGYFAITSILYVVIDGKTIKLEATLFGVLQCFSAASVIPAYFTIMLRKQSVANFVKNIQNMVGERIKSNNNVTAHYASTERKTFKSAKWIFIIHYLMYPGQEVFGASMSFLYAIIRGEFDFSTWYVASKALRTPFDRSTLNGYLFYVFFEGNLEVAFVSAHISSWTLFVGFYIYFDAFIDDLNTVFNRIDENCKRNQISEIRTLFYEAIEFQVQIFKLFHQFAGIMSIVLLFELIFGCAYMSTSIFEADLATSHVGTDIIMIFSLPLLSMETVLPYCYLATKSLTKFQDCARVTYFSSWYLLPTKQQRAVQMIIEFSQRERQFSGKGFISCSLENFVMIIKTAFSYYIMIKKLTLHS